MTRIIKKIIIYTSTSSCLLCVFVVFVTLVVSDMVPRQYFPLINTSLDSASKHCLKLPISPKLYENKIPVGILEVESSTEKEKNDKSYYYNI